MSVVRALAWKEARHLRGETAGAVIGIGSVGAFGAVLPDALSRAFEALPLLLAAVFAALAGGAAVASERAGGSLPWLRARPVELRVVLRVKLVAHGLAAAACLLAAAGTVALTTRLPDGWSAALAAPAWQAWALALIATATCFAWSFALSLALDDGLTAALAGASCAVAALVIVTLPILAANPSDGALGVLPWLAPFLVALPAWIGLLLARRLAGAEPGRVLPAGAALLTLLLLGGLVAAIGVARPDTSVRAPAHRDAAR